MRRSSRSGAVPAFEHFRSSRLSQQQEQESNCELKSWSAVFLGLCLAIFAIPSPAQSITSGDVVGNVTDQTGAAMAGAECALSGPLKTAYLSKELTPDR